MAAPNYFVHPAAAARYAQGRPFFHPLVIERFRKFSGINHVDSALDVACGTGQSTLALTRLAARVVGVDASEGMLSQAPSHPRIHYLVGPAERLPLDDRQFDLITVALAYHWFDQDRFLAEAARVLKPGGWLVLYNNAFNGRMKEDEGFAKWAWEVYPKHYPTPARDTKPRTRDYSDFGLILRGEEHYGNEVTMSCEQLTAYLLTQSNTIAAVEQGAEPAERVYEWILSGVQGFFGGKTRTMLFGGNIIYLQKDIQPES